MSIGNVLQFRTPFQKYFESVGRKLLLKKILLSREDLEDLRDYIKDCYTVGKSEAEAAERVGCAVRMSRSRR